MNSIENLKINDYILVIEDTHHAGGVVSAEVRQPDKIYTGIPFKVVGLCVPFVLTEHCQEPIIFDLRKINFTKATRQYVGAYKKLIEYSEVEFEEEKQEGVEMVEMTIHQDKEIGRVEESLKQPTEDSCRISGCPNCKATTVELVSKEESTWTFKCLNCGKLYR